MERYDPSQSPDPEEWLELDESVRIELVREFHTEVGEESGSVSACQISHADAGLYRVLRGYTVRLSQDVRKHWDA